MKQAARILEISEEFQRLKRTLLLFCSAVILIRIADIDPRGMTFSGLTVSMSIDVAAALIWVGAAYYFAGFVMETTTVLRHNSDAGPLSTFIQSLNDLSGTANSLVTSLDFEPVEPLIEDALKTAAFSEVIPHVKERLVEIIGEMAQGGVAEGLLRAREMAQFNRISDEREFQRPFREQVEQLMDGKYQADKESLELVRTAVGAIERRNSILTRFRGYPSELASKSKEITRIAKAIYSHERWNFYVWHVASGVVLFVLATVAWIWPDLVTSTVNLIAPHLPSATKPEA